MNNCDIANIRPSALERVMRGAVSCVKLQVSPSLSPSLQDRLSSRVVDESSEEEESATVFLPSIPLFGGRWWRPPQLVVAIAPCASSKFHPGIRESAESATDGGCTYCFLLLLLLLLLLLHILLPAMQRRNTQSIPLFRPSIAHPAPLRFFPPSCSA